MKLSEALRLGEFALPAKYQAWIVMKDGKPCGGCAVGRTCIAAGYRPKMMARLGLYEETEKALGRFMSQQWPWTMEWELEHMDNDYDTDNDVLAAISDLYETYKMPLSMIADWVETIEPAEVAVEQESPCAQPARVA